MAVWGRSTLLVAFPLWMCFGRAAASLPEPYICYVLDGILFLYGLILTALYCKIKFTKPAGPAKGKQNVEEGIYTGLTPHAQDTYETIGMKK
ncbi:unnamed protein product [Pleuronectes platessa]|uniref:High affinity immunoglobulin epsilon receptor subunit gamma n=1 Tax=Pleuronectes platessa TaxID=8262 RepID=A0A9N7YK17_PLEPL|nr:high affinity immunoglobulin epsilon receptor subunit gamma [Pleuronectes platessa]CAB1428478.1 unnamed protein product [Pleuronectes platessa]